MSGRRFSGASHQSMNGLFSFALISLFVVLALLLVVIGARVYRGAVDAADQNAQLRASLAYVTNKVRAADAQGMVRVEERDGVKVLSLGQDIEGVRYETLIYLDDGALRELFVAAQSDFQPEYGAELARLDGFWVELEQPRRVKVTAQAPGGGAVSVSIALHSGG